MKKIALLAGLLITLCSTSRTEAQVRVNIQFGMPVAQERWAASDDDYYYLPDPGVYYNLRRRVYVFPQDGRWMFSPNLPPRFGNCDLHRARYYRIRECAPFRRHAYYYRQYRRDYYSYSHPQHDHGRGYGHYDRHDRYNDYGDRHGGRGGYNHHHR